MKKAHIRALGKKHLRAMSQDQLMTFSKKQLGWMSSTELQFLLSNRKLLSPKQIEWIKQLLAAHAPPGPVGPASGTSTQEQQPETQAPAPGDPITALPDPKSMTPAQIRLIDPKNVAAWTTAMIQGLSTEQVRSLTLGQIAALRPDQIAALTLSQLIALSRDQAYGLTAEQLSALSKSQLAMLNLDRTLLSKEKQTVLDKTLGIVAVLPPGSTPPSVPAQPPPPPPGSPGLGGILQGIFRFEVIEPFTLPPPAKPGGGYSPYGT